MKLFSIWQPLSTEDARTALVFNFLRHAPPEAGLHPWISEVLGRPVKSQPLRPENFWPRYKSRLPEHHWTEPELVFTVDDGGPDPLWVIVEAKPGYGMHREEQLVREVVDTASGVAAQRIVLIAVGADIGEPLEIPHWRASVRAGLDAHGLAGVQAELYYSSWASLGAQIGRCAASAPALGIYAADVIAQLRFNALLGYEGAPMYDDLDELNISNAFVLFNRSIAAARQFYLTLHDQEGFRRTGLGSTAASHRMLRDGASTGLTQDEEFFQISTFICLYRRPTWDEGLGAYAAFYFAADDEPQLHVGAYVTTAPGELHWEYGWAESTEDLNSPRLRAIDKKEMPFAGATERTEWTYDERPWRPGGGDEDVAWAVDKLSAVARSLA
jgi:hypothetical protein